MYGFWQRNHDLYPISDEALANACKHAQQEALRESCGIIVGGEYLPMENVHPEPYSQYKIDPNAYKGKKIEAVIHSHPQGLDGASYSDMRSQIASQVPHGIVVLRNIEVVNVLFFGDQVKKAPYVGRPFHSGVYDCYSLLRDYYEIELGIKLRDYPRDADWYAVRDNPNLLENHFRDEGFKVVSFEDLRPHDVILGTPYRSTTVNHCAIHKGDGLILHHYGSQNSQRLSLHEPIYNMKKFITHCLRHESLQTFASKEESNVDQSPAS